MCTYKTKQHMVHLSVWSMCVGDIDGLATVTQGTKPGLIKARALRLEGNTQSWVAPTSVVELLNTLRSAKNQQQSVRLVGGNTGPGVYKDWPVDIDVLVSTTQIPELTSINSKLVRVLCCAVLGIDAIITDYPNLMFKQSP